MTIHTLKVEEIPVVIFPHTCARCGGRFGSSSDREYVCPACRAPRPRAKVYTTEPSRREWQIIALIRQAKANKEIAYELCLSEGTVKEYLNRIFKKLGVANRTALALWQPPDAA